MTTTTTATPVREESSAPAHIPLIFACLMLIMLLASLSQTVLSTAMPTIVGALDGADQIMWIMTAYLLSSTVMMPIYGRFGDRFGRRPLILTAIVLFTGGSLIGGIAPDMPTLIAGRLVQGLGGGGLIVLSQAAIADVVPARQRGKYMGFLGAAFAVSTVAGPLLGGWFTEGPGWRWTFWMNVPLGLVAFIVTAKYLRIPVTPQQERARLDYTGMTLLVVATSALILATTWGGHQYDWLSAQILGLAAVTIIASIVFVVVELKADEPVIPMALFRDRNFNLTTIGSLALGVAMFGAIGYMPTYLQMSAGVSATKAGLMMISMMGGLLVTSIVVGAVVSRTGKYKIFPIVGTIIIAIGLYLMSTIKADTSNVVTELSMLVFGIGIGMGMQVLTLIVQNSVPHRIMGTATASSNFFRQVGATLGSAVVGSMFTQRLLDDLSTKLPDASLGGGSTNSLTPELVHSLPAPVRDVIIEAYNGALMPIFLGLVPIVLVAVIALIFVKETALATTIPGTDEARRPLGDEVTEAVEVAANVDQGEHQIARPEGDRG